MCLRGPNVGLLCSLVRVRILPILNGISDERVVGAVRLADRISTATEGVFGAERADVNANPSSDLVL